MGDSKDNNRPPDAPDAATAGASARAGDAPANRALRETPGTSPDEASGVTPSQAAELRIGYLLPTRDWVVMDDRDLTSLIDQARLAEELGFDSVWAGDSPVTRPRADPLLVLAAAAALTERVTLGTAVLLPALRHPILLAHQLATLDLMSGGRLVAGMGAGFPTPNTEAQFEAIGVGFKRRVSRMEEAIHAMRRLWNEDEVSYQGTHFAFNDVRLAPRPARRGGPPIWLAGGGSDAALRRVARMADGWLPYPPDHRTYAAEWTSITSERSALLDAPNFHDPAVQGEDDPSRRGALRPDHQNTSQSSHMKRLGDDALSSEHDLRDSPDLRDLCGSYESSDSRDSSHGSNLYDQRAVSGGNRNDQSALGDRLDPRDPSRHRDRGGLSDRETRSDLGAPRAQGMPGDRSIRDVQAAPTPALYATLCLDDDPDRARLRLRTSIERYYNAPLEVVEGIQAMFAGTPKDAAAWLQAYVEAGARHVVVRLAVDDHRAALEEFAAQVMPLVRHA
ncbi:hypothetical protein GCM10010149_68420 [Nonomuraea roseoviolacea subsp. roseoviolacea]|uniref:LLM class flavin-dependent oxidoreductase n=1 Tax=Nonomuraea roseoviolacea TaxID=103837 RepID=UPI0031DBE7A5